MSGSISPLSPTTQKVGSTLKRTDCCSALFTLSIEFRNGFLTQTEILARKAYFLAHIPSSQICRNCKHAFEVKTPRGLGG